MHHTRYIHYIDSIRPIHSMHYILHIHYIHYILLNYMHRIHALMHQCIHIKAIVVCICTYIYIHTYRAQTTDMTCIRIYITYIAWIHIVHSMEQGTRNKESKHTVNTPWRPSYSQLPQNHSLCSGAPDISNIVLGPPPNHAPCSSAPGTSKISGRAELVFDANAVELNFIIDDV